MTNVSLCERITRGNAVHKMQHTLHLVIVREPVTRDAVPDLDERRLRRTAPHRTSAHRSERRGLPTGGTVCTVHARMAFVGMSLLSFSRAFRSVLLPAPCTVRMLHRAHTHAHRHMGRAQKHQYITCRWKTLLTHAVDMSMSIAHGSAYSAAL